MMTSWKKFWAAVLLNGLVATAGAAGQEALPQTDRWVPTYHLYIDGCGEPGDPNGAFYADGRYHLMSLYRAKGTEQSPTEQQLNFRWRHRSSADLVNWTDHGDSIVEEKGDNGAFSGGAFLDDDGTCYLSYWMLWGARGLGLVKSDGRNYTKWTRLAENPVVKATGWGYAEMEVGGRKKFVPVADPSNIWKKDGVYYMLAGNLLICREMFGGKPDAPAEYRGDHLALFSSRDLKSWRYEGDFYQRRENETAATGWTDIEEDNMCPTFLPLPSSPDGGPASGKYLLSFISHCRGAQYYIGKYDRERNRFVPESHGRMTWKDKAYFAPEAMIDGKGRQLLWAWLLDNRDGQYWRCGWSGVYALPRSLWLRTDGTLGISVPEELKSLRGSEIPDPSCGIDGDCCELELELDFEAARTFALEVRRSDDGSERTVIRYDQTAGELVFDLSRSGTKVVNNFFKSTSVERAPFRLADGERLRLRVFIDGDIVEVFANDRQALARQVHARRSSRGIRLSGAQPLSFRAYSLRRTNQDGCKKL